MKIVINSIEADKPTINNRIYPRETMEKACTMFNEKIKTGKCFVLKESPRGSNVLLHNIGMQVKSCKVEDSRFVIEATPMNTPAWIEMEKLLNIGASVNADVVGSIKEDRTVQIDEIVCFSITRPN